MERNLRKTPYFREVKAPEWVIVLIFVALAFTGCRLHDNSLYGHVGFRDFSFSIDDGATYTKTRTVNLSFSADSLDPTHVAIHSSKKACENSPAWESYDSTKAYTLDDSNSLNAVYARLKDEGSGQVSDCVMEQITHDNVKPIPARKLSFSSQDNRDLTVSPLMNWDKDGEDATSGISHYEARIIKNSDRSVVEDWQEISNGEAMWDLSLTAGVEYLMQIRSVDGAGNPSAVREVVHPWSSEGLTKPVNQATAGAVSVHAADLDGDGDRDVLSASSDDDKIAWYENTDGAESFSSQNTISTSANEPESIYAADLDGDDDMDVLSASNGDDKIAWYKNTDGAGSFSSENVISTSADGAQAVYATDVDGDDDIDILSASEDDHKIAWYENTDGAGSFSTQNTISTSTYGAESVYAADLDGDGDRDVLSASATDDKIVWYER